MKNFDVVRHIYPNAIFSMINDDINQITWVGQEYEIPTADQIGNAINEIHAKEIARVAAKESAQAKLAAIGLTAEEVAAL